MERIYNYLPEKIFEILYKIPKETKDHICEVRLRKDGPLSVSTYLGNYFVTENSEVTLKPKEGFVCTASFLNTVVSRLCQGSVYRYMSTINSGYIVTKEGVRVGVCGESVYEGKRISSVASFSSVNIRLPRDILTSGDLVSKYICENKGASVLIVSPPGYGKTTVIRSVAQALSQGRFSSPMRVSVIDERGEILPHGAFGLADRFLGYSKPDGIEIAVRLFSPEYIVCDEIGLNDDTEAMLSVQNSGVPFVASAHGENISQALKRPNINKLVTHKVFDTFVRLEKTLHGALCIFEDAL